MASDAAKREADSAAAAGFEFLSPWMPARDAEAFYTIGFASKHGRMWRWRLRRVHGNDPKTGKAFVTWVLDESTALVEPPVEYAIFATAQTFDEPRTLMHPRDKLAASAVVARRWHIIQTTPPGAQVPS